MKTRWTSDNPIPLPEYPRPQMVRKAWMNLNGDWEYAILPKTQSKPNTYQGRIRVPYPVESALSGVKKAFMPDERLWYRRYFHLPGGWQGKRILIHFGAVDFSCTLWVNTHEIGSHQGGYIPFSFDITSPLEDGENEIILSVTDPTDSDPIDSGLQERGKQVLEPKGIWYTAVSGIWQTVWLEPIPEVAIESLKIVPDVDHKMVRVQINLNSGGNDMATTARFVVRSKGMPVASLTAAFDTVANLGIDQPILWSPSTPHLYDLDVQLIQNGQVVDSVQSYFAMRKFGLQPDTSGHLRFALNDEPIFLYGPLDQGYFPDGLYTPPSEEAMRFDIEYARDIGCNMIRKHIKIEPARWYYHCDRLGMIVWQDMPNGGLADTPLQATLSMLFGYQRSDRKRLKRFGRYSSDHRNFYLQQLQEMIGHLHNFPCIAVWVPFNESWGQFHAREIAGWVKELDPTRLVDHASGWFDQGAGDWISRHIYVKKLKAPKRSKNRAFVLSEFGGYSFQVPGHLWKTDEKFGYRFYNDSETLTEAYVELLEQQLIPLISQGLTAAIYTQTTDVEIEVNGYLTYDRIIEKMNREKLIQVHKKLH